MRNLNVWRNIKALRKNRLVYLHSRRSVLQYNQYGTGSFTHYNCFAEITIYGIVKLSDVKTYLKSGQLKFDPKGGYFNISDKSFGRLQSK